MQKRKRLLHEQMELIAKQSKGAMPDDLSELSDSMSGIYRSIAFGNFLFMLRLLVLTHFFVGVLVHVKNLFGRKTG